LDAVFLDGDNDYDFEVAIIENPDNPEEPLIFEHPDGVSIDEINEGYHLVDDSTEDSSTFASSDYDDWNVENLEDSSEDLRLDYYDDDMCF
jgi:hypothetical protein